MKVWVVIVEYEPSYFKTLGVYASEERANARVEEYLNLVPRAVKEDFLIEVHQIGKE